MGVEFKCGSYKFRRSYSGLQGEKLKWLQAAIKYLQDESNYNDKGYKVIKKLEQSLSSPAIIFNTINYGIFMGINKDDLRFFGLMGLYFWLYQSDCDSYYCPGEALEIRSTFVKLRPFMSKEKDYKNLLQVLDESIANNKNIEKNENN